MKVYTGHFEPTALGTGVLRGQGADLEHFEFVPAGFAAGTCWVEEDEVGLKPLH